LKTPAPAWELPLKEVRRFQFARGGTIATSDVLADLKHAAARYDREMVVEVDDRARDQTLHRIATARKGILDWLAGREFPAIDLAHHISRREGDHRLYGVLEEVMATRGLEQLDREFSAAFVSNPASGEIVKGHAIVLGELGLCPYRGKIVRHPELFTGKWSKSRRAEHLVTRLAFAQVLFSSLALETVTLYRGAAMDGPL
jgi:hypothetical protein